MKILTRAQFLEMPKGTVFRKVSLDNDKAGVFRMKAAEDIAKFLNDAVILLHYSDNYTRFFIKVCKALNIDIETWLRPYPNTDRYGNKRPYLTVYIIFPRKDNFIVGLLKANGKT